MVSRTWGFPFILMARFRHDAEQVGYIRTELGETRGETRNKRRGKDRTGEKGKKRRGEKFRGEEKGKVIGENRKGEGSEEAERREV